MTKTVWTGLLVAVLAVLLDAVPAVAQMAVQGVVRSDADGVMEGVVVIAQREGAAMLTSVTTDARGRFGFPRTHLQPGRYALRIRAAGYVLPGETVAVAVGAGGVARADLVLKAATVRETAEQLTHLEWLRSMPGTDAQKDLLVRRTVNCGFCHDMGRVMRTRYTAEQFVSVIGRMSTYAADNTSACGSKSLVVCDATTAGRVQIQSVARPPEEMAVPGSDARRIADYLASTNLSGGRTTWSYPLKPLPRPRGRATRAIVTVYPVPRQPTLIHDMTVDERGQVWYGDSGWGYLGRLDPKTGAFKEYQAPQHWPDPRPGLTRLVGVQDVEADPAGRIWAVVGFLGPKMAYFDTATERWSTFDMPAGVWAFLPSYRNKGQAHTTWTVGRPAGGSDMAPLKGYRLNLATGKVEAGFNVMVDAAGRDASGLLKLNAYGNTSTVAPFCYQIDRDPRDNLVCADFYGSRIIVMDAKTGVTTAVPTPTPNSAPRRGRSDAEGRFWFGEFWGDKVGVFDPKTRSIREFAASQKYMSTYAAAPDHRGEAWASSTGSDRLLRVNPKTGEVTEYLMPVYYDARKVVVDPSTSKTTIWLPNKNLAQLIRVEPLD